MNCVRMICRKRPPRARNHCVAQENTRSCHPHTMIALNAPSLLMSIETGEVHMNRPSWPLRAAVLEQSRIERNVVAANHQNLDRPLTLALQFGLKPRKAREADFRSCPVDWVHMSIARSVVQKAAVMKETMRARWRQPCVKIHVDHCPHVSSDPWGMNPMKGKSTHSRR